MRKAEAELAFINMRARVLHAAYSERKALTLEKTMRLASWKLCAPRQAVRTI